MEYNSIQDYLRYNRCKAALQEIKFLQYTININALYTCAYIE